MSQSPNEMFQLLEAWGLSDLKAKFKANYVVIQALEYLTEADIIELIPKIGQRAIFRARLNQWRQQQKSPAVINIPEPKKIKIEPLVEMKVPPEPQPQQLITYQLPTEQPIFPQQPRQPNGTPKNFGNLQKPTPKPRAKRVYKKNDNANSATTPKIQSRVQQFIIGSPPSTTSITTPTTVSTVMTRLPASTSITSTTIPNGSCSNQAINSPNTPLYNIPATIEFRRHTPTIPPPITTIPAYIRPAPLTAKQKPVSTVINSDNLNNTSDGVSSAFETDLTPFATSIIRVDTQYPNITNESVKNSIKSFKRTTIIQKLKGDSNTTPPQLKNPKPIITPKPIEKLQNLPQVQSPAKYEKSPEFPKPKSLMIPKEEPVEIIEDDENTLQVADEWNDEHDNKTNSKNPELMENDPEEQSDTEMNSHAETDHDLEPNPEVEEFTLADATSIPDLPDIMRDDLMDSDHDTNDNDNDNEVTVAMKNFKKSRTSRNSQNSQEVKQELNRLDIRNVLMNSKLGRRVIKRYVAEEILDEGTRRLLIELIAQHCFDNKIHITPTYCKDIAEEIIEIFPNERMEDYWMRKGKKLRPPIYNKYHCIRRDFARRKSLAASEQTNGKGKQNSTTTKDNDYDDDDNLIIS